MYYILDENNKPVKVEQAFTDWANKFTEKMRRTAFDEIDGVSISTVFLGIDHSFGQGEPLLWETMCFSHNPDYDQYQERYTSHEDAMEGHRKCVKAVNDKESLIGRKTLKLKL